MFFFFIPFPFPNWGNGFFQFPSRSQTSGMELSIPIPVPELPKVIPAHPCWRVELSQIEIFLDNICWQKFMILKKQFQLLLPTILHCCLSLRSLFRRDGKRFLHKFGGFPFKFKYLIREQPLWRDNWFFLLWISQKGSHTEVKIRKLRPFLSELDSLLILF